jgi:hypothetical protein
MKFVPLSGWDSPRGVVPGVNVPFLSTSAAHLGVDRGKKGLDEPGVSEADLGEAIAGESSMG